MSNSKEIQRRGKEEKKNKRQQPVRGEEATGWGKGRGRSTHRQRAEEWWMARSRGTPDGLFGRSRQMRRWLEMVDGWRGMMVGVLVV